MEFREKSPQIQSMHHNEFDVLFYPTIIKRTEHHAHTGVTAAQVFSAFGEFAQED